jgi:polyferredoxin
MTAIQPDARSSVSGATTAGTGPSVLPASGGVATAHSASHSGIDLLRVRALRRLVLWGGFPYVFQAVLLAVFVALIVLAWGVHAPDGVSGKLFAKTNLVTLLVWGVWWPAMIWVAVLFGRVWCMVCPLELVGNVSERAARRLGVRQRTLGKAVAAGGIIVVLYWASQLLVMGLHLHRVPAYTAVFLLGLLVLAALTGALFRDRAFCRGFCPVGLLLGTYGRGGMLAVRRVSGSACRSCADKRCLAGRNRGRIDARSCPSLLNPPKLASNRDCLVCCQCTKACGSANMGLLLRRPFPASDERTAISSWPVTIFVMLVSGFVTWELFTEWPAAEQRFLLPATWLAARLGVDGLASWFQGAWTLLVVPPALWLVLGAAARALGATGSLTLQWRRLAMPLAVVIAAGHMSKGLAKFVSWAPFMPHAVRDAGGSHTAAALTASTLPAPVPWLGLPTVAVAAMALVLGAAYFAAREHRLANAAEPLRSWAVAPVMVVAVGFCLIIFGWI